MSAQSVTIRCPAKVNLGLRVMGLREDGYHEVRTVLQTIALSDELEVSEASEFTLEVRAEGDLPGLDRIPEDESNLVLQAARLIGERRGVRGARFRLLKRIPMEAGLGGASSDAAGALLALDRLYRLGLGAPALHRLAAGLGSDVPFFLYGGAALALGRGEEIYPLPEPPLVDVVLAVPAGGNSTPEVYRAWDDLLTSRDKVCRINDFAPWCLVLRGETPSLLNDLEEAALRLRPELRRLRSGLESAGGADIAMTGTGSAFFGLCADMESAEKAAQAARGTGCRAITTTSLGREDRDRTLWIESQL